MEDKGCYYLVNTEQGSKGWKYMRKGRITMSNLGKVVGHASAYYKGTMEQLALELKGIYIPVFKKEELYRMNRGTAYEPIVRDILAKKLNVKIDETGFAIWKLDKRFGASLDGIIDSETGIEIKCPARMYGPILEYMKDKNRDPDDYSHIWRSQYDQIVGNGVITGRKYMYFCVYGIEDKKLFIQKIKVDYNYWNTFLYPTAKEFYEKYMAE
jgi:hypothetical protein